MKQQTFGIIKPDAVSRNLIGKILSRVEEAGLKVVAGRLIQMTKTQAEGFYAVHKERPFFGSLVGSMTSGPVFVFAMEGENAILKWRELMGATDPAKAAPGTIRKDFALDIERNSVHGSDAPETAAFEVPYFFKEGEVISR